MQQGAIQMPKTAIVFRSPHHGNTKKLLDAIVRAHPDVVLIKAGEESFDPENYDIIGFASGVYAGKLHREVRKVWKAVNGKGHKAFAVFTCGGSDGEEYGAHYMDALRQNGFETCGFYWCAGHDSFGPLRLVGGINKGKPDAEGIQGAVTFYESLNV
jgi:flavodoxin